MFQQMRQRSRDESGFTLIELLVVILIIGILAAIAIPSFINQKGKANDASAKTQARTAQTASESLATDKNGQYTEVSIANLKKVEPTLNDETSAKLIKAEGTATTFAVESESVPTKDTFKIERDAKGVVTRSCEVPAGANRNGCPEGGSW